MFTTAPDQAHIEEIGLPELRRHARDVISRAEAGTEFVVTVAGRVAARITGAGPTVWCRPADLDAIYATPSQGPACEPRDYLDQSMRDTWDDAR